MDDGHGLYGGGQKPRRAALRDIKEMARAGSTEDVHIKVEAK